MKGLAKVRLLFCSLFALILILGFSGCREAVDTTPLEPDENSSEESWVEIIEFTGTAAEGKSDLFKLSGGSVRVTYTIETETKEQPSPDSATSLIYILKKDHTKSKDDKGNLSVAVFDVSAIGAKENEQKIIAKEAGEYYIDVNTSSVVSYRIKIEEKITG